MEKSFEDCDEQLSSEEPILSENVLALHCQIEEKLGESGSLEENDSEGLSHHNLPHIEDFEKQNEKLIEIGETTSVNHQHSKNHEIAYDTSKIHQNVGKFDVNDDNTDVMESFQQNEDKTGVIESYDDDDITAVVIASKNKSAIAEDSEVHTGRKSNDYDEYIHDIGTAEVLGLQPENSQDAERDLEHDNSENGLQTTDLQPIPDNTSSFSTKDREESDTNLGKRPRGQSRDESSRKALDAADIARRIPFDVTNMIYEEYVIRHYEFHRYNFMLSQGMIPPSHDGFRVVSGGRGPGPRMAQGPGGQMGLQGGAGMFIRGPGHGYGHGGRGYNPGGGFMGGGRGRGRMGSHGGVRR